MGTERDGAARRAGARPGRPADPPGEALVREVLAALVERLPLEELARRPLGALVPALRAALGPPATAAGAPAIAHADPVRAAGRPRVAPDAPGAGPGGRGPAPGVPRLRLVGRD